MADDIEDVVKTTGADLLRELSGGGNTGVQLIGTDPSLFGSESAGPMGLIATGEAVECGGGKIPVYVEGQGFRGCYSPDESWILPFLDKTSKIATIPADDPAISNLIDPEEGKKLQELIEQYGEDVVRDMKNKYDELVDFIGNVPEDPLGSLQKMIEIFVEGTTGISPDCTASGGPAGTALPDWIRNCVTVGVLVDIGIPGLPGGLGSIFKGATIGEIEEGLKNIGKKFEDIVNGTPTCGEKNDQECTPEQILKDLGDWVVGSVKDIFADEEDEITIESILGKLGDIFGGVLGGIIYGEFKDLINGEIEDVIGIPVLPFKDLDDCENKGLETIQAEDGSLSCGECKQPGFEYDPNLKKCVDRNATEPFDETQCTEQGYFEQNKDACEAADYVDCDATTDEAGNELTGGIVKGIGNCGQIETLVDEDCPEGTERAGLAPQYDFYDINQSGTFEFSGNKYEYDPCNPSSGVTQVSEDGEEEDIEQPVDECAEITDENADACGKKKCSDGTFVDKGAECPGGVVEEPDIEEDICSKPRPTGLVTFDLIDQQRAWDRKCGGVTGPSPCDQQDRVTNEDGSCGPCKPGFIEDRQGLVECIRAPEECNDCSCAEYAAANPQECGETPTTTETGASASIGSSTGGDFSGVVKGISYTPQPVPEILPPSQFGQFGMLTQAPVQQPSRNTDILGGSIVAGLLGKYMV